jgi:lipopolysaccharide export system permease protein
MVVLVRYLTNRVGLHVATVLLALTSLVLAFELMQDGDQVLRVSDNAVTALGRYAVLRLADVVAQMLPFACLLGVLLTVALLLRNAELVALGGSGISPVRLIRVLLPAALLLGAAQFVLDDQAVPATLKRLHAWGVGDYRSQVMSDDNLAIWLVSGSDIVRLSRTAGRAGQLVDIMVFERDDKGTLLRQIRAQRGVPDGDGWLFLDAAITSATTAETLRVPALRWDRPLDFDNLPLLSRTFRELRLSEIGRLKAHQGFGQQPAYLAESWFYTRLASVLSPLLMVALVIALARWRGRAGALGPLVLLSIGIGFAYFAVDRMALAMGESGLLPPWLSALGGKLALFALIGTLIVRDE